MSLRHVDGFSSAGEVLAELCRCHSPICPLPHGPAAVRSLLEPGELCACLEARCRQPHTQEAAARFVLSASGFELWSLRHRGLAGGIPPVRDDQTGRTRETQLRDGEAVR